MIHGKFKLIKSDKSPNGWLVSLISDTTIELNLPTSIYNSLKGSYMQIEQMLEIIDTIYIVMAGVTYNYTIVDEYSQMHRSILKSMTIKKGINSVDDSIDVAWSIIDYEKYHLITVKQDITDNMFHGYIDTPLDGRLNVDMNITVRKRAKYWIDEYIISTDQSGCVYVKLISEPISIINNK